MMNMRIKVYNFLVNRHPGIQKKYHQMHDQTTGFRKLLSYLYLLWLNLSYYLLRRKALDQREESVIYEEKNLPKESESKLAKKEIPQLDYIFKQAEKSDVVSFDIFDTLILRPFSSPVDVFWFLNDFFPVQNLKDIRMLQEYLARLDCRKAKGHSEITLADVWQRMEQETGIPAEQGMAAEMDLERRFCYANSYIGQVFQRLQAEGKRIIIVSDMYLSSDFLTELLDNNGFSGFEKLYVSCEYGCSKADGGLYAVVKNDFPAGTTFFHIGDNTRSDIDAARKAGMNTCWYPNVNRYNTTYRAEDMSPIIGSAYRGIVNNHLYNGMIQKSQSYEYGFIYGGLFVLGYCRFIHQYVKTHKIGKILFLSRDGEAIKAVYDRIYPNEKSAYVYWSRTAATKLMAKWNRFDYFLRFLYHKVNQDYTIEQILRSMDLEEALLGKLPSGISEKTVLRSENVETVKKWLIEHFDTILAAYERQNAAAECYYRQQLEGISSAVAVDIGWAGSGALALSCLCSREWRIPCEIIGIIAGTNTIHNAEPYATERFRQTGKLAAYLYSPEQNRDLFKKHDPNRLYNVYWELLLSSTSPQFVRFEFDEDEHVIPVFGKCDPNPEGIQQIRKGILDFADSYIKHFEKMPEMFNISGRDAYAPMLAAASRGEKYLKEIYRDFDIKIGIG